MTRDELLEEAKRRYPVGTKYACVKDGQIGTSIYEPSIDNNIDFGIFSHFKGSKLNQYIYYNNKWAEVIEYPKGYIVNQEISNYSVF